MTGSRVQRNLEDGQVSVRVSAYHLAARTPAVVEYHLDLVGAFDHVVLVRM